MVKLTDDDWQVLLPVTSHKIGKTKLGIKPLGLEEIGSVAADLAGLYDSIRAKGLDIDAKIPSLAELVLTEAPGLIAAMSGLDVQDVKRLPAVVAIDLAAVCVDVNVKSSEDFLKNLVALAGKVTKLQGAIPNQ